MENVAKGADGRRLFTAEFKRQQVDRVLRGEIAAAELSRDLGIARSLVQRWKFLATKGAGAAVHLAFALDCRDREVPAHVATPHPTTGAEIRRLIRKTVFARHGNEKPEVPVDDLASAARVMEQIPGWIEDYSTFAPHSSLGMLSSAEFRREQQTVADTGCLTK